MGLRKMEADELRSRNEEKEKRGREKHQTEQKSWKYRGMCLR